MLSNQNSEKRVIALAACAVGVIISAILAATAKSVFGVVLWLIICSVAILGLVSLSSGYFSVLQDMYKPKRPVKNAKPHDYVEYDQRRYQPRREEVRARSQPRRKPIIDIPLDDEPVRNETPAHQSDEYVKAKLQDASLLYAAIPQGEKQAAIQQPAEETRHVTQAIQASQQNSLVTQSAPVAAAATPVPTLAKSVHEQSTSYTYGRSQQVAETSYKITPPKFNPDVWRNPNTNIVLWPDGRVEPASKYIFNFDTAEIEEQQKTPELKEEAATEYVETTPKGEAAFDFETAAVETRNTGTKESDLNDTAEQIDSDDVSVDASNTASMPSDNAKSGEIIGKSAHNEGKSKGTQGSDATNDTVSFAGEQSDVASLDTLQTALGEQSDTADVDTASRNVLQTENTTIVNDNGQEELVLPDIEQEAIEAELRENVGPEDSTYVPSDNESEEALAESQGESQDDDQESDTRSDTKDEPKQDVIFLPAQLELWNGKPAEADLQPEEGENQTTSKAEQEGTEQKQAHEDPSEAAAKSIKSGGKATLFLPARNVILLSEPSSLEECASEADGGSTDSSEPTESAAAELVPDVIYLPASLTEGETVAPAEKEGSVAEADIASEAADPQATYVFPPIDLLNPPVLRNEEAAAEELRDNAERLAATLTSFGVDVVAGDAVRGPAVTRYEFTLGAGIKLSKITNLQDDIALALGAVGVRIAPIPDKQSVVGIEVPNRTVSPVSIRTLLESEEFRKQKSPAAFAVGEDISGARIIGDVSRFPHVLVAGTTGSGKSVCMNSLIISLLYKSRPEDIRFIMVDPKMVELAPYNGIPHLLIPVVTDPKKAAGALQWAVYEMMKRYQAFSEKGVKDLASYNTLAKDDPSMQKLPTIVVVIDELADLMLIAAKEVEESICRVAQMGRAAGIHLIIATQSPRADVITGLMKANIPSRIAFAVASSLESRIVLDTAGAEKLVGKGDMLYAPLGQGKPQRVQGCFISAEEIERVVEFLKANGQTSYDASVMEHIEQNVSNGKDGGADESQDKMTEESGSSEDDTLLEEAVEVLLETGQASTSMLQRRLKLGYSRAARIIDMMEERGIVGPFEGSKPRKILITRESWKQRKGAPTGGFSI